MDASGRNASRKDRKIPSRVWNKMVRAADQANRFAHSQEYETTPHQKARNVILVKNTTGVDVPQYGVLAFDGVENGPNASLPSRLDSFCNNPVLTGVKPKGDDTAWGVTLEPIKDGRVGRIAIDGAVPVMMRVTGPDHPFAGPESDNVESLKSGTGSAAVLWSQDYGVYSPTTPQLAIIRIGYPQLIHIGKTQAIFDKGTDEEIALYEAGPPGNEGPNGKTLVCWNKFATIPANKWVAVAPCFNGGWYVIAAECG